MALTRTGAELGGRLAVEDLEQRRHRIALRISPEARDGGAGQVAEQASQGDLLGRGELVLGHTPRGKLRVHVRIQGKAIALHQMKRTDRGHGFAHGRGLEQRARGDRGLPVRVGEAIAPHLDDLSPVDDRERQAFDAQARHLAGDVLVDLVVRRLSGDGGDDTTVCPGVRHCIGDGTSGEDLLGCGVRARSLDGMTGGRQDQCQRQKSGEDA